jgi:predicted nucleic acid-binding protein
MGLVLDASAVLAWIIERSDRAERSRADELLIRLESDDAIAPAVWPLEVANGLIVAERRGLLGLAKSTLFLAKVSELRIEVDPKPFREMLAVVLPVARAYGLTSYDAAYLELAIRTGRDLATFDRRLAEAARAAGVKVFGDPV